MQRIAMQRWNGQEWSPCGDDCKPAPSTGLRLATFNILTDGCPWAVRLAILSDLRFEQLKAAIRELRAEVLLLNEVTRNSLQILLDSDFVRESYYVSELPNNVNGTLQGEHGCVMFSMVPVAECYALQMQHMKRQAVMGVLAGGSGSRLAVCSLHTLAHQSERNKEIRAQQIHHVASTARTTLRADGFIIAGDLNLHFTAEDGVVPANQLLDTWAETHLGPSGDQNPGFTFDAERNTMIPRYIPGETRKMRLDRILVSEGCCLEPAAPCELWATEAVDASRDLFLSDHFGLVQDFKLGGGWFGDAAVRSQLAQNQTVPLEAAPTTGRFLWALPGHTAWLALRSLSLL
mmetsp:Transcript_48252/g.114971  ORF Transcript_48252/g.114971 Transcript_48252/m.114971 type:complete len:347 (+) Transcript_48252:65-1105(+)|eukprot:CAMPEP_0181412652 /NCGR_PEP_ID=MMETSP1110-20121109/8542_1 /TAXON_ID=174948 /ORGANISM="Symbiodinium sp., Strain CCMP421" /LENGTH=346 /DNA_ID=CAMNT_0023535391 /DNA_START=56 /DNA_END=1096 /DNA_ORIENTATION=-